MSLKDKRDDLPALNKIGGHYDKLAIEKIVQAIEGGMRRSEICLIYGLSRSTICCWMREYGSASYKVQRQGHLNNAQKRSMVRSIREGRMTLQEAKLAYHMPSYKSIMNLLSRDEEKNDLAVDMAKKAKGTSGVDQENKKLQKALEEAQMKIKALNTLIDVAEDQFKIPIRKKPGAKQSK